MIRFTGTHVINLLFITATYTFYISTQPYTIPNLPYFVFITLYDTKEVTHVVS